ncbi:hypothetical protein [Rhodoferax sp.]|uniref:hypothetical protein n=1 Tax=Rhodoferax sp. TaxID=50421 RepID=UPI002753A5E1|nr:hypothetical protein [Rhodoferax sp.]
MSARTYRLGDGLLDVLTVLVFGLTGLLAYGLFSLSEQLLQAAWLSWQWLTTWPLLKVLEWSAAALTIYGAWLLANPGHRWTSWGFVFFLAANVVWISYAWFTGQGGLFVQQLVLTGISLQGIWNTLLRPVLQAFNQLFEGFENE